MAVLAVALGGTAISSPAVLALQPLCLREFRLNTQEAVITTLELVDRLTLAVLAVLE
ncbi:MAG: hypothetical protein K0U78_02400 [Actinomycetia bacterium]|nr:hypothetical protein [Actinomycetes bacterium]